MRRASTKLHKHLRISVGFADMRNRSTGRVLCTQLATIVLASAVVGGAAFAQGAGTPHQMVLSLSKAGPLDLIDPATLKVIARIPVGGNPHEVIATPDGRRAYVSNYGNGTLNTITVVDLIARKPL